LDILKHRLVVIASVRISLPGVDGVALARHTVLGDSLTEAEK